MTRVDELLFITSHLIEILERENAALALGQHASVADLIEQKTKLSRAYEIRVLGMAQADEDYTEVEPALLEALKQQGERLNELMEVNARELSIGIDTSRRFMEVLSQSVKNATPTAGTYGANGASGVDAMPQKGHAASVAIDEQL
ncbi:hypothetical protein ACFL12_08310 [Pseudomonadota bacterium]